MGLVSTLFYEFSVSCVVSCDAHRPTARVPTADILEDLPRRLAYNGTFMVTGQAGSTATLTFNGTSVWLYGSKGKGNGAYNVTLDGSSSADNGFSDRDLFQQVLFAATGLDGNKTHRLTVENVGTNGTNLVIDSVSGIRLVFLR